MILSGSAVHTKGLGSSLVSRRKRLIAAWRSTIEQNAPRLRRTRDRVPLDWAATQNNLASALLALGERESGAARLEEAVVAYHAEERKLHRPRLSASAPLITV